LRLCAGTAKEFQSKKKYLPKMIKNHKPIIYLKDNVVFIANLKYYIKMPT